MNRKCLLIIIKLFNLHFFLFLLTSISLKTKSFIIIIYKSLNLIKYSQEPRHRARESQNTVIWYAATRIIKKCTCQAFTLKNISTPLKDMVLFGWAWPAKVLSRSFWWKKWCCQGELLKLLWKFGKKPVHSVK